MKESSLGKILDHPDKEDIVTQLVMGTDAKFIGRNLKEKYGVVDPRLALSPKVLSNFKDEYLNYYLQIQRDASQIQGAAVPSVDSAAKSLVAENPSYREKLEEYLNQEIDIKKTVKKLIITIEYRADQLFNKIQENPSGTKTDYALINYMNTLVSVLEKYDVIINGSQEKITQQNNINIQVLDQHVLGIQNIIRKILTRLDQENSLMFIDLWNEELEKMKPEEPLSIEERVSEVKQLAAGI